MVYIVIWVLCGLWSMHIARSRGHNAILWFILGFIFGPFGVLFAALQPKPKGDTATCPFCAETINSKAIICKHCGRDIVSHPAEEQTPSMGQVPPPPPQVVSFGNQDDIPPWERKSKLREMWDTLNARGSSIDTTDGLHSRAPLKYVLLVAVVLFAWVYYLLSQPADTNEVRRLSQDTTSSTRRAKDLDFDRCTITEDTLATKTKENYEKIIGMARANDNQAMLRMIGLNYAVTLARGTEVQRLGGSSIIRIRPTGTTVELYIDSSFVDCYR